jgi:D-3-phosphoglycerate dehydrogenase
MVPGGTILGQPDFHGVILVSPKIAITTSSFGKESREPVDDLKLAGFELAFNPHGRKLTKPETVELLRDADGLIAGTEALDREVLSQLPKLRIISRVGTAVDNVDREYAKERGIPVYNTPDGPTNVAVIGLGRIGKALVRLLQPFGVTVLAVDPLRDEAFAKEFGVRYVSLEDALREADVMSLHLSGSTKTALLGAPELAQMKPGALLVNAARGGWIDETALLDALNSGKLGGAYLDVFAAEPYRGPLAGLENVVLTAHIGSYALECRIGMEVEAAGRVIDFFKKGGTA